MSPTVIVSGIITLSTDAALQAKLRAKLAEYQARFTADPHDLDALYKGRLLHDLLRDGVLDTEGIEKEYAPYPQHDRKLFKNAVNVISVYNGNDQTTLSGGTGLK